MHDLVSKIEIQNPRRELTIATTLLIQEQYFYSALLNRCKISMGHAIKTAGVRILPGGIIELYINPEFFLSLTRYERVGLLMHEMLHLMHDHINRGHGLNPSKANTMMDNTINQMIPVKYLPTMAITPERMAKDLNISIPRGKSFEDYYLRVKDQEKKLAKYNNCPVHGHDNKYDLPNQGQDQNNKPEEAQNCTCSKYGSQKLSEGQDASLGEEGDGTGKKRGSRGPKVLDDHDFMRTGMNDSDASKRVVKDWIKDAVNDTIKSNHGEQSIPREFLTSIEERLKESQIDWTIIMRNFIGSRATHEKKNSRQRPNRRFGLASPGKKTGVGPGTLFAADSSGSVSDEAFHYFMTLAIHATAQYHDKNDLIFFDSEIYSDATGKPLVYKIGHNKKIPKRPNDGGTRFQPVIDFANQRMPDVLIIFTDGIAPAPKNLKCPVLWIISGGVDNPELPGKRIVLPANWMDKKISTMISA